MLNFSSLHFSVVFEAESTLAEYTIGGNHLNTDRNTLLVT